MILETMKKRRSVRDFKPEVPSDVTLSKLIEAAITAPSAGNKQPWRFLIIRDKDSIESAALKVDAERQRLKNTLDPEFQEKFQVYSDRFSAFRNAPTLIIPIYRVFVTLSGMLGRSVSEREREFLLSLEHHSALVSVSLTIQNILLMVEELGLGACCMTGPLIAAQELHKCLQVPEGWRIASIVAVGYPNETPIDPGRKGLRALTRWL